MKIPNPMRKRRMRKIIEADRLRQLERQVLSANEKIDNLTNEALRVRQEKESKERRERNEKTKWNKADKFELVYNPDQELTAVYINGHPMHGAQEVSVEVDGDNQCPLIRFAGYGSVTVRTEDSKTQEG